MVLDAAADGIAGLRAAVVMVQFLQPQDVCGSRRQEEMKQRIEDWLRERRIKRIGKQLMAARDRDEKCRLYELFRAEIANRSPQQVVRMVRRSEEALRREGAL